MKNVYLVYLLIAAHFFDAAAQPVKGKITDKFTIAKAVHISGHIGKKLDQSYKHSILNTDVKHLIEPFHHRNESRLWQSEFWGKWFTSAVLVYRYKPEPSLLKVLNEAKEGLIATQTPDGYIGNYSKDHRLEQWDIWGRKYTMLGLLDFYELTKDKKSLSAAVKLADHLIGEINAADGLIVNKGNYRGMAASSVLEPIIKLYRLSGNKKYLEFARQIVLQWETDEGPKLISKAGVDVSKRFPKPKSWYSPEQGQKAYEMMSCYEGLLELYRVTGDDLYKEAVEKTWTNIKNTEINIAGSGASEEMWFGGKELQTIPVSHFQETCVTVTWIKLNQQLLRLTGEAKYADEIERSYYNALLASLNHDASRWAKYTPLNGQRLPGSGQCGMNLNCCDASGPRGLFTLPLTTVMSTKQGMAVNFYVDGLYHINTPSGRKATLVQRTEYPATGTINLSLKLVQDEDFTLQLRIPAWSNASRIKVNTDVLSDLKPGEFVKIKRKWSSGDMISLELDMRGKVHFWGDTRKFAAVSRGPIVLARDSRLEGVFLSTVNRPVYDNEGYIQLETDTPPTGGDRWMQYRASFVPEAYTEQAASPVKIKLVDYASAGNGKEQSMFKVWFEQLYSPRE